jgi:hypothetical protein
MESRRSHLIVRRVFVCLFLAAPLLISACVKTEVTRYRKVTDSSVDSAYVQPDVDFSRYSRLLPVPLEIYYVEGQAAPDSADLSRIRQIFRTAFLGEIGDDFPIVDAPGPDVLGVRASLVDLELSADAADLPVGSPASGIVEGGKLSFFMELTDSQTGDVLVRAGDQEKTDSTIALVTAERDWTRVETAAAHWARLFKKFLDENLSR